MKITKLIFLFLFLSSCGYKVVDTGHRGIKTRFGKVVSEPLPEGLYFFNPITTAIEELDIREKKYQGTTNCYSKDAQIIDVSYAVNFRAVPSEIHNIYQEVGRSWARVLLQQILEGNIKEVTGKYTAVDLIEKRQEATTELTEQLREEFLKKRINLVSFEITNMDFDNQFEEAVKRKVIAVEQAKEAKNKTVRVREEAEQKIIAAKAEAESMRIRSQALSQNKNLVEYEAVQKWDGKMPQYMLGNSMPFIKLNGK